MGAALSSVKYVESGIYFPIGVWLPFLQRGSKASPNNGDDVSVSKYAIVPVNTGQISSWSRSTLAVPSPRAPRRNWSDHALSETGP